MKIISKFLLTFIFSFLIQFIWAQENYLNYHQRVIESEILITSEKYPEAIEHLDQLFSDFSFAFLREIKLATELAAYENDLDHGFKFIRLGIQNGWSLKDIKKNKRFSLFLESEEWNHVISEFDSLHAVYESRIDNSYREKVQDMFKKDQKKALGALLKIGDKAQEKYNETKFGPHSEQQLKELDKILEDLGYPGEKLIGNNYWAATILSHHNSVSKKFINNDTLYLSLKPKLWAAFQRGELSQKEWAEFEDWKIAVLNDHGKSNFGFLGSIPNSEELEKVDKNRASIGMRSVALRNSLIDIETRTGMNLHLPKGWQNGKITSSDSK